MQLKTAALLLLALAAFAADASGIEKKTQLEGKIIDSV